MENRKNVYIKGLNSCCMRRYELQHWNDFVIAAGHEVVEQPGESEVMLIWTCAFREDVAENSIEQLNQLSAANPHSEVIALGCFPDIDRVNLEQKFKGQIVSWIAEGNFLEEYFRADSGTYELTAGVMIQNAVCDDASEYRKQHPDADVVFHDQFCKILISEGCPYDCAYCTEKRAFPLYKSFKPETLLQQAEKHIIEEGQKRLILVGDCIGQYGIDMGLTLPDLMDIFFQKFEGITIALSNLHPKDFLAHFDMLTDFLTSGKISHVNLPIQSACNRVLEKMRRGCSKKDLIKIFGLLAKLNFRKFDTHIICGFPGESREDFLETVDFLCRYKPAYVLVSRYFETPSAPSAKLPDKVPASEVQERIEIAQRSLAENNILFNIEGTDFVKERLRRLNVEKRTSHVS